MTWLCLMLKCVMAREYFEDVDRTWETFEETLWGHVSNFYKLSKERYSLYLSVEVFDIWGFFLYAYELFHLVIWAKPWEYL